MAGLQVARTLLSGVDGTEELVSTTNGTTSSEPVIRSGGRPPDPITSTGVCGGQASSSGRAGTAVGGRTSHGFSKSLSTSVVGSKPRVHHLAR